MGVHSGSGRSRPVHVDGKRRGRTEQNRLDVAEQVRRTTGKVLAGRGGGGDVRPVLQKKATNRKLMRKRQRVEKKRKKEVDRMRWVERKRKVRRVEVEEEEEEAN